VKNQLAEAFLKIHWYQHLRLIPVDPNGGLGAFLRRLPSCQQQENAMSFANICAQTSTR
jgi:hypothetical protein